ANPLETLPHLVHRSIACTLVFSGQFFLGGVQLFAHDPTNILAKRLLPLDCERHDAASLKASLRSYPFLRLRKARAQLAFLPRPACSRSSRARSGSRRANGLNLRPSASL